MLCDIFFLLVLNSSTERQASSYYLTHSILFASLGLFFLWDVVNEKMWKCYLIQSIKVNEVNMQLAESRPWLLALFETTSGQSFIHPIDLLNS